MLLHEVCDLITYGIYLVNELLMKIFSLKMLCLLVIVGTYLHVHHIRRKKQLHHPDRVQ